jgi:broad specificity phosphatase PhoE
MDDSLQIYLIRHGATEWSKSGRHTGRTDIGLTAQGRSDASRVGPLLASVKFQRVLVSSSSRAVDTARLAGFRDQIETDPNLLEWDYGDYEGVASPEIRQTVPGWTVWTHPCPNGETAEQVGARADSILRKIASNEGPVALFSHGHILRVLAARWLGLPPTGGRMFELTTASISRLGMEHESKVIQVWNQPCDG